MRNPTISIVIPIHDMPNGSFFLWRLIQSIVTQTYKDYEIVIVQDGLMAENTNAGIRKANGELVKILYLDDYFAHENALKDIVESFMENDTWLVTGCLHQSGIEPPHSYHEPKYTDDIYTGNNCIGSPSVLTFRRGGTEYFDTQLSWLLDCDLYKRLHDKYGLPTILNSPNVVIGLHQGQTSNLLSDEDKKKEQDYLIEKYA